MKGISVTLSGMFSVLVAVALTPRVGEYSWLVYLVFYVLIVLLLVGFVFRNFDKLYWILCLGLIFSPFFSFLPYALLTSLFGGGS